MERASSKSILQDGVVSQSDGFGGNLSPDYLLKIFREDKRRAGPLFEHRTGEFALFKAMVDVDNDDLRVLLWHENSSIATAH